MTVCGSDGPPLEVAGGVADGGAGTVEGGTGVGVGVGSTYSGE